MGGVCATVLMLSLDDASAERAKKVLHDCIVREKPRLPPLDLVGLDIMVRAPGRMLGGLVTCACARWFRGLQNDDPSAVNVLFARLGGDGARALHALAGVCACETRPPVGGDATTG